MEPSQTPLHNAPQSSEETESRLTKHHEQVLTCLRESIGLRARDRIRGEISTSDDAPEGVVNRRPVFLSEKILNIDKKSPNILRTTRQSCDPSSQSLLLFGSMTGHVFLWDSIGSRFIPNKYSLKANDKHVGRISAIDTPLARPNQSDLLLTSTASTDGEIKVWKEHETCIASVSHEAFRPIDPTSRKVIFTKFHPALDTLLISSAVDGSWAVWDFTRADTSERSALPLFHQQARSPITCSDIHGDGSLLACGEESGSVNLWDTRSGESAHTMHRAHNGRMTRLLMHPFDGYSMFTAGSDGLVKIWNLRYPKLPERSIAAHTGIISDVRLLHHDRSREAYLVTSGFDCQVKLWDIRGALREGMDVRTSESQKNNNLIHQASLRGKVTACEAVADAPQDEDQLPRYRIYGINSSDAREWTFEQSITPSSTSDVEDADEKSDSSELDELEEALNAQG
ncbi:hypothetical protein XU18_2837 [Perkinsela sp. CCAP 1560/4]|nr:hypothetical protein XU18_2837 [Perkinsela sp. CCAP 1560/4]|eukprot:KNH06332.1 hypothetical protein XU18_2837 [Perkinsela sp. CCAP 1560/4]